MFFFCSVLILQVHVKNKICLVWNNPLAPWPKRFLFCFCLLFLFIFVLFHFLFPSSETRSCWKELQGKLWAFTKGKVSQNLSKQNITLLHSYPPSGPAQFLETHQLLRRGKSKAKKKPHTLLLNKETYINWLIASNSLNSWLRMLTILLIKTEDVSTIKPFVTYYIIVDSEITQLNDFSSNPNP